MKEFFALVKALDWKGLFLKPSENVVLQMFRYLFVGGTAFVVDAGSLWAMASLGLNEYIATAIAFILGLIVNFLLSKKLVFTKEDARMKGAAEFVSYGVIGVVGLGLTELLMFVGLEWLRWHLVVSKICVTAIVLVWNFAARKILLYSKAS